MVSPGSSRHIRGQAATGGSHTAHLPQLTTLCALEQAGPNMVDYEPSSLGAYGPDKVGFCGALSYANFGLDVFDTIIVT